MNQCVIVIPIHNATPSTDELSSFTQCFKILGSHPIYVVAPNHLDLGSYKAYVPEFKTIYIDPSWQSDLFKYNQLKISLYFYDLFKDYEYLLTYELDAFVFRDELIYWCEQKFDYIGAPWFEGLAEPISNNVVGIGNSGFSLRNIQSSLRILKRIAFLKRLRSFWFKSRLQSIVRFNFVISFLKRSCRIKSIDNINQLLLPTQMNEDFYWSKLISEAFGDYKLASVEQACIFSFDANPSYLYKRNGKLPFGCHAWGKYEPDFWMQFISPLEF